MIVFRSKDAYGNFIKGQVYCGKLSSLPDGNSLSFSWVVDAHGMINHSPSNLDSEDCEILFGGIQIGNTSMTYDMDQKLQQLITAVQSIHLVSSSEPDPMISTTFNMIQQMFEEMRTTKESEIEARVTSAVDQIKKKVSAKYYDVGEDDALFKFNVE